MQLTHWYRVKLLGHRSAVLSAFLSVFNNHCDLSANLHAMPRISNIGGSLTSAVVLTLLAWGVRLLRATAQRTQDGSRRGGASDLAGTLPRFFAALSPAALRMLV